MWLAENKDGPPFLSPSEISTSPTRTQFFPLFAIETHRLPYARVFSRWLSAARVSIFPTDLGLCLCVFVCWCIFSRSQENVEFRRRKTRQQWQNRHLYRHSLPFEDLKNKTFSIFSLKLSCLFDDTDRRVWPLASAWRLCLPLFLPFLLLLPLLHFVYPAWRQTKSLEKINNIQGPPKGLQSKQTEKRSLVRSSINSPPLSFSSSSSPWKRVQTDNKWIGNFLFL